MMRFRKGKSRRNLEKFYAQRQEIQHTVEEKLSEIECESGNVEVQRKNIKKCVLDTMSDLVGKFERTARKSWIAQEIVSKMDERSGRMSTTNKEGRTTEDRGTY
jgi:hypothetical protein